MEKLGADPGARTHKAELFVRFLGAGTGERSWDQGAAQQAPGESQGKASAFCEKPHLQISILRRVAESFEVT